MPKATLPTEIRDVFQASGVIPTTKVPTVDALLEDVKGRGGRGSIALEEGGWSARVALEIGKEFDGFDSDPALALSVAYAGALKSLPKPRTLFDAIGDHLSPGGEG